MQPHRLKENWDAQRALEHAAPSVCLCLASTLRAGKHVFFLAGGFTAWNKSLWLLQSKYRSVARFVDNVEKPENKYGMEKKREEMKTAAPNHDACLRPHCFRVARILTEILMQ